MTNKEKQANGEVYFCTFCMLTYLRIPSRYNLDKICNLSELNFYVFFLFDLILHVPVNNFSVMLGWVLLG